MQKKLRDFAAGLGLTLPPEALERLEQYAALVWEKKDTLNLTSVTHKEEIFTRHLCDGLVAAALVDRQAAARADFCMADAGSGAGYIGLTVAAVFPQRPVTLIESLQRRCSFLNWAVLKLGLARVTVQCARLGQQAAGPFDVVTERAMGQLAEVLPLLAPAVKPGGLLAAYQSVPDAATSAQLMRLGLQALPAQAYTLPGEDKQRYLAVFKH